ncbi:hypothetical protein MLD38_023029 [Melastoma candidum]|uniref:Uncharacterized protein n=1 Tax=Melastoma candidum TaxID=119954 RepID=A0ACB9QN11_9MYRT|nr:hypothetical protein MLD38_023029 [Melastoma candidum]
MGAACCVAARDRTIPVVSSGDHRSWNSRHSPTWSFRWENRGRVAGEDAPVGWSPNGTNCYHSGMDPKLETTYTSEHGSSLDGNQRRTWPKAPCSNCTVGHVGNSGSDTSISRAMSTDTASQQVESRESLSHVFPSSAKLSVSSTPSSSSPSTPSSQAHLQHASSIPSKRSNHSQKLLQLLPSNTNPAGSSLGSEAKGTSPDGICKSSSHISASTCGGVQACGFCLKSLTERSSWSGQKIIANSELPVVAVLICGHVYHADCLEAMTSGIDKYDPACPVCTLGERQTLEISEKALVIENESSVKRERRSRNQGVNSEASCDLTRLRISGSKGSSSASRSPSARPFFGRHFSFGSRGSRTLTEVHPNQRRRLFWTMSSKE